MDLSIIIVSYRTPDHLRRCLTKLAGHESRASREIVVVDNESGDESPEVARAFPGVTVIETGENLGFAGGVNRGLMASKGRFMLVMNPDIEVVPGSLDALVDFLESHPETGIAAPKLLNTDGTLQYSCRRFYTLGTVLLRRTFLGRIFPKAKALRRHLMLDYDHETPLAVDWVAGAAMCVRREALDDVGHMDERYFLYFEDVDWCTRMQTRGWLVHYVPDSVMTHHWQRQSQTFGRSARTHLRSGLRFYERWGGLFYMLRQYRGLGTSMALVLLDALSIVGAFLIALVVRRELAFVFDKPVWPFTYYTAFMTFGALVFLASYAGQGLYREVREGDWVDVAFRVMRAAVLGALIVMASTYILDMQAFSRVMVIGSLPLAALLTFLVRRAFYAVLLRIRRERLNLKRVALIGNDPVLDRLESVMHHSHDLGWEPVRIRSSGELSGEGLVRRLRGERVSEVVVTPASFGVHEENLGEALMPLRRAGHSVRVVSAFLAGLPARARVEAVGTLNWLSLDRPRLRTSQAGKRIFDLVLSLMFMVLGALPSLLWMASRILTGRSVWEPRTRFVGRWRETFPVRRFAGGGWLRSYPMLGAVLRGTLSVVGLRPLAPGSDVPGGESWERVREQQRPGLVGPWSLTPELSLEEEMQQELRYLEEWSPEGDLKLLTRVALKRHDDSTGRGSPSPAARHTNADPASPSAVPESGGSVRTELRR